MTTRELLNLGVPKGPIMDLIKQALAQWTKDTQGQLTKTELFQTIHDLVKRPREFLDHERWGQLAGQLAESQQVQSQYVPRATPAPYKQWGQGLEPEAVRQMDNACQLPISLAGALMPDAHVGYGLPIGGVLATQNAVIPYAVGMDIACRMKLTVLDLPVSALAGQTDRLCKVLESETRFGVGAEFQKRRDHAVMDEDWSFSSVVNRHKDKAWGQLGTSGSGNHFVEYGTLTLENDTLGLKAGVYLALLSHSGSRGTGNEIASFFSKLAITKHPELPKELTHLAWLEMDSAEGQEYWAAMELMGHYAAANHQLIHRYIAKGLGVKVLLDVENHHNFAWKESHFGQEVIVHRKGATPADQGALGIIPGSMGAAGYIIRGKGEPDSLHSASHGAGRAMSRKKAKETFTWSAVKKFLKEKEILVLSADLDEAPMAYKDIESVMAAQQDLVEPLARFNPKIVKMAPPGDRPED
jgi:tRNA-splicing ligase RtcB (3'-phosphate/5'-hydroxy nucleic acid ligase)